MVTGEIGGSRRAIVFNGDVMNTTSRIENATPTLGRNFVVSEVALARMDGAGHYAPENLGPGLTAVVCVKEPQLLDDHAPHSPLASGFK